MSFIDIVRSVLEVAIVLFTIWGLFHEERFVAFEQRLFSAIRRKRLRVIKGGKSARTFNI